MPLETSGNVQSLYAAVTICPPASLQPTEVQEIEENILP